jgi:hypothetical protein
MKKLTLLLIAFLLFAAPVFAQSGDNAQAGDSEPVRGVVTGRVLTGTEGGALPTTGEPMLHILDNAAQEQGMEHSELLADGTFRFEAVRFVPGWQYVAMLNYQNVTYFSEPAPMVEGRTELDISVTVYEATTATDAVHVAQQHVFFDAVAEDQLLVGEIYILSNSSDRTVALGAGAAPETAPLAFALPEGAQEISVENNRDGRFRPTAAGFVDTAPLHPGEGRAQVVVRYTLPYRDGLVYTVSPAWPVDALNILVPAGSGLTIRGEGLPPAETIQMGNSADVTVFNVGPLATGDIVSLKLEGELAVPPAAQQAGQAATPVQAERAVYPLAPVAIVLGVLLLALALWLHRRPPFAEAPDSLETASFDAPVTEIALLDEAHEAGQINENDYHRRRSLLFTQAQQPEPEG